MKQVTSPAVEKYLKKVANRLDLPKELKQQVCDDLRRTIADQMADGTAESRVLLELGAPKDVAKQLNQEMEAHTLGRHPYRFVCLGAAILSAIVLGGKRLLPHILLHRPMSAGTIGIIGGADGPTSIFVTATQGGNEILWVFLLILGIFGFFWFSHKHKGKKD